MNKNEIFLKVDGVGNEADAVKWSINAALQRNRVYENDDDYDGREKFRDEWARLIREESKHYQKPDEPISDEAHCAAIARISDALSSTFRESLVGGRLRFGTSQKAFNLYLKYLWSLGEAAMPPHCPIDGVILNKIGIGASWTKNDNPDEYMEWINRIRAHLTLADWENEVWLRWRLINSGL